MIRRLFVIIFIFSTFAFPSKSQINTDRMLTIGRNALYFEDYVLAIQYFNKVIRVKPYLAEPYFYRGLSKYYLEDYNGAVIDLSEALEKNPFFVDAYNVRGIISSKNDDHESAINDYNEGLSLEPGNTNLLVNRGSSKIAVKQYESAIADFDLVLKKNTTMMSAYLNRGTAKASLKDSLGALADFTKVVELYPNMTDGYATRGVLYYQMHDYTKALKDYEKVVELKPDVSYYYMTRGVIRYQLDDLKGTMADFDKVIELDPKNSMAYNNRGILRAQVGDLNRAVDDFSRVLALDPSDILTLYNRATLLIQLGLNKQALADLNVVIENYPKYGPAYYNRSMVKQQLNDMAGAKIDYQTAIKFNYDQQAKASAKNDLAKSNDDEGEETQGAKKSSKTTRKKSDKNINNYNKIAVLDDFGDDNTDTKVINTTRGKVQNNNIFIDLEPVFGLTYFTADTTITKQRYYQHEIASFNKKKLYQKQLVISNREAEIEGSETVALYKQIKTITEDLEDKETLREELLVRGVLYGVVMNYTNSLNDYSLLLSLQPNNVLALFNRAYSRHKMVEMIRALEEEKSKLNNVSLKGGLSQTIYTTTNQTPQKDDGFEQILDYDLIIKDLTRVIELAPDFEFAYYNRGIIHCLKRDFAKGIDDFSRAIKINPDFAEAYFNRGLTLIFTDKEEAGTIDLSKAGELGMYKAYNVIKRYGVEKQGSDEIDNK